MEGTWFAYKKVFKLLEANGADIQVKGEYGRCLLYTAIEHNQVSILIYLSRKLDINRIDNEGISPLIYAVKEGFVNKKG